MCVCACVLTLSVLSVLILHSLLIVKHLLTINVLIYSLKHTHTHTHSLSLSPSFSLSLSHLSFSLYLIKIIVTTTSICVDSVTYTHTHTERGDYFIAHCIRSLSVSDNSNAWNGDYIVWADSFIFH